MFTRAGTDALTCWIALVVVGQFSPVMAADPAPEAPADAEIQRWMDLYAEIATEYEVALSGPNPSKLRMHPTPLLKYTNPVRERQQHGAVFVWSLDGRPQVVGTLWSKLLPDPAQRRIAVEFHSLSTDPLIAMYRQDRIWFPRNPGLHFQSVPEVAPPEEAQGRRWIQLRRIARDFEARLGDDQEQRLRLMPAPLHQYSQRDGGVLDGGLFTFVMATDPELLLLIEARRAASGEPRWHFAAVRFTNAALELRYRDAPVWMCPAVDPTDRTGAYFYDPQVAVRSSRIE